MTAVATTEIPRLGFDPFSIEFFADPFPTHEKLREAGPVVYLDKWGVYGVARYQQVHAVLNDPQTFCSSRGVGLSDFAKETPWRPPSLILEADPPAHTRTRARAEPGAVGDRDAAAARLTSPRRRGQGRRVAGPRQLRCHRRSCGSLSALGLSRRAWA